jgi:hypothetical protein
MLGARSTGVNASPGEIARREVGVSGDTSTACAAAPHEE